MRVKSLNAGLVSAIFAVFVLLAGTNIPTSANASDIHPEIDRLVEDLSKQALFAAIIDGDPEKKQALKQRLSDAYVGGGLPALERELVKIGEEFGQNRVFATFPTARAEDIVAFISTTIEVIRFLQPNNANVCYQWLYGQMYNDPIDSRYFSTVIGQDRQNRMVKSMVDVVTNAYDQPVAYDRLRAQQQIQEAVNSTLALLDQGSLQVIAGIRPPATQTEIANTCRATGELYAKILSQDNSADTIRELFAPQQTVSSFLGFAGQNAIRHVVTAGDPEEIFGDNKETLMNAFR